MMKWFKTETKPRYFVAPVTGGYLACVRSLRYSGGLAAVSECITCLDDKGFGVCAPPDAPMHPRAYHASQAAAEDAITRRAELMVVGR